MSENKNKTPTKLPITTPPQTPPLTPQQPNPIVALAQAIGDLNRRMSITEIEVHKANANNEILRKTIELLEKRFEFNEKKI